MFRKTLNKFPIPQEKGQGLVEYALILVLIAVVVIAILLNLGPAVAQVYCRITNSLQPGSCVSGGVIASYQATKIGSSLHVNVTVSQNATITVNVPGKPSQSQSCTPSSCPQLTFGSISGSGSGTITSSAGDNVTFSY
jgi:pilus assembly protein Flp/PilA